MVRLLVGVPLLAACAAPPSSPEAWLREAAVQLDAGDSTASVDALEHALAEGLAQPSIVLHQPRWRALLDQPTTRARLRDLLLEHARESRLTMVRDDEPGDPLLLTIEIVDDASRQPLSGVRVQLVQVDASGVYFPVAEGAWNPRLFCAARTDDRGVIEVRTIRPGYYADVYDAPDEPAHIHVNIDAEGYRPFHAEFGFDDDPRQPREHNTNRLATVNAARARIQIPLQRRPPTVPNRR